MTGEQMETNIFIGPTYYMRLKQMVKDKINYRARIPHSSHSPDGTAEQRTAVLGLVKWNVMG